MAPGAPSSTWSGCWGMLGVSCALEGVHSSQEWLCPPMLVLAAGGTSPSVSTGVRPARSGLYRTHSLQTHPTKEQTSGHQEWGFVWPQGRKPSGQEPRPRCPSLCEFPCLSSLARRTLTPGLELPMDTTLALGHGHPRECVGDAAQDPQAAKGKPTWPAERGLGPLVTGTQLEEPGCQAEVGGPHPPG